jgi:hypothetical protein
MKTERPDASAGKLTDMTFRHQYEILRSLLFKNGVALQLMSDLEADLNHLDYSDSHIQRPVQRLLDETLLMAQELNILTGNRHRSLYGVIENIRGQVRSVFQAEPETGRWPLAVPLNADESFAPRIVGGKAAGLATLRQHFPDLIPQGFVITTAAYRLFIDANGLADRIRILLGDLDVMTDHPRFRERTGAIRELILAAPVPEPIREAIERLGGPVERLEGGRGVLLRGPVRQQAERRDRGPRRCLPVRAGQPVLQPRRHVPPALWIARGGHAHGSPLHAHDRCAGGRRDLHH